MADQNTSGKSNAGKGSPKKNTGGNKKNAQNGKKTANAPQKRPYHRRTPEEIAADNAAKEAARLVREAAKAAREAAAAQAPPKRKYRSSEEVAAEKAAKAKAREEREAARAAKLAAAAEAPPKRKYRSSEEVAAEKAAKAKAREEREAARAAKLAAQAAAPPKKKYRTSEQVAADKAAQIKAREEREAMRAKAHEMGLTLPKYLAKLEADAAQVTLDEVAAVKEAQAKKALDEPSAAVSEAPAAVAAAPVVSAEASSSVAAGKNRAGAAAKNPARSAAKAPSNDASGTTQKAAAKKDAATASKTAQPAASPTQTAAVPTAAATDKTAESKEEKKAVDLLKEKLEIKKQHAAERFAAKEITAADSFAQGYKSFLTACKTERECVAYFIEKAEAAGFEPFDLGGVEAANSLQFDVTKAYFPGKKVYFNNRGKSLILAVLGNEPLENGLRIAAAHIDSPRLDLKPVPFYEDKGLALAKTHYYGGIKKYQWVTIPLALHGVVVTKSGESIQIVIGEKPEDPKFCITDLLPHLGKEQYERSLGQGIKGEELNIVIGSRPLMLDGKAEGFKLNILKILNDRYGITEADFLSAELEAVPAYPACDIGLDAGLVGAYGQDDRVCAYPSVEAILAYAATIQPGSTTPTHTCICVLADKEEIGSCGNTGLESNFLYDFICDLSIAASTNPRTVLRNSKCLSADVNAGFDPTWPGVMEANNAAFMGQGLAVTKYTGSRGKNSASDASAEFVGWMRRVFDEANVQWQMAELGKVDEGGGGTVAAEVANLNIDVLDVGVPVLSMHAPFELASKTDIYQMRKAALAFFAA